ncbi:phenolic glucoside malonyltransferase 1 [Sorghum bicolor]|nr:phenolic glucoside malonyltransferase 1 [Sorghum bicolor]|eukprot:XP_002443938.1 phenolic glucoside malonyltransferase 1 [Sorghum bicolor]
MPPSVNIIEEARVAVPRTAALPPEPIRLSALDAQWITLPLIQRVLIFVNDGGSSMPPPFASAVDALRASLAETLARFPTLAGRIVHVPATGDAAFDCGTAGSGGGGGVRFLVAEASDADAARLAEDDDHDAEAFAGLVPALDTGFLPAETLAAQVTRLRGGGLAVGVAMHHAAVDGRSVWRFLRAWAAACRGEGDADAAAGPPTTFDRAVIRLPGGGGGGGEELARSVLRKWTPDLPVAAVAGHFIRPNLSRRTFTVTAQDMRRLKQRVVAELSPAHTQDAGGTPPPSSFVAVAALAWVSFVRSKRHPAGIISAADEVYLFFFADCRARLDPPPGDGYFGTCISGCLARATAGDLLADDGGVGVAAAAVAEEVRRAAEDPLAGWDWMSTLEQVDMDRLMNLAGSTRFDAYEAADFGWGPPARTELVTMNHDGQVVLVAGKGGGVQASVSLHPAHMDAYKSHFLSYFG